MSGPHRPSSPASCGPSQDTESTGCGPRRSASWAEGRVEKVVGLGDLQGYTKEMAQAIHLAPQHPL